MARPPPYAPVTSFITYQSQQSWFPGQNLDVEFNAVEASIAAIEGNLAFIQKDDRSLGNGTVGWDQFSPTLQLSLRAQGFTGSPVSGPNTWFGLQTFPDGITLLPGGVETGLNVTHNSGPATVAGSQAFPFFYQDSPTYVFNQIAVIDQVNVTTPINHGMSAALGIGVEMGGANSQGTKVCLELQLVCDIAGANPTYGRDRACLSCDAFDSVGDGGTGTGAGTAKGTLFSAGFQTVAASGALNLFTVAGFEINAAINTGASAYSRFGGSSVAAGNLTAASIYDAAWEVSTIGGGTPWKTGLMFTSFHGGAPVQTTGTLIGTDGVAFNAAIGIDFTGVTFSNYIIKHPNFLVDNLGGVSTVTLTLGGPGTFLSWTASTALEAPSNGVLTLTNHALTDFGRLQLGGTSASFPSIKRNATGIDIRLADDSGYAPLTSASFVTGAITASGDFTGSGNVVAGAGNGFKWTGRSVMLSPADGNIALENNAQADFGLLQFGGTTNAFPAIKRSSAALRLRLADDSADAALTLSVLSSGANQVVGARVTGYAAMTGTPDKATVYTTAGVTLPQLAGRIMQLQADLTAHGLIGA